MIDFIEYVVAELKSKRLSKTDAAGLVRQFSSRPSGPAAAILHPLLHRNTSDLSGQRYGSTFTGDELFLADHRVKEQKVLPGVAYLEMARAAIVDALPELGESAVLELHNTVWAQPVIVTRTKDVSIALLPGDGDEIDYEVYSGEGDDEVVHCQGRAVVGQPGPARLDLEQLKAQMTRGGLDASAVYATFLRTGLQYGPAFQTISAIHRGNGQALAELRLPAAGNDYVLHPSLMDGALQAALGLVEGDLSQPHLPFALETLRILAPCKSEMFAWVRYAQGSTAADNVVKVDVDLCDDRGNVCVQFRGFSSRVLTVAAAAPGRLFAAPAWQASDVSTSQIEYAQREVLTLFAQNDYNDAALACFERIQTILRDKPQGKVLLQVAVTDARLAGLTGLLRTAALENPSFTGQLVILSDEASLHLLANENGSDAVVRHENGTRQVLRWQEATPEKAPVVFKDGGVYLITGGLGALGTIFTNEILARTGNARVVLTGRAESPSRTLDARVTYRRTDLADRDQVQALIAGIGSEFGRLDGILHSAGMIADAFLLKKESAQFSAVLAPKVAGTLHLDEATRDVKLDFFVLFSSVAGAMGNLGQADYAAANGFLDQFAAQRNAQVDAGQRHGRTRSINWPLWQSGGMAIDAVSRERLHEMTGMQPLQTATGVDAFYRIVASPSDQMLVAEGDLARMRRALCDGPAAPVEQRIVQPAIALDAASLGEKTQDYLRRQLSDLLKVPAQKIDPRAALENYGIDSMLAMKLTNQLEKTFGSLSKTLFFEYQNLRELAEYFTANHAAQLAALFAPAAKTAVESVPAPVQIAASAPAKLASSRRFSRPRNAAPSVTTHEDEPIAIVGLSGRYPEAVDLEAYWENLRDGKDCIVEVPKSRWDWREYFSEDRTQSGRHFSKWGGFIEGVDEFDPLFFNISPAEAEQIDPQERLFLQHVWMAVEDAGYTRAGLQTPSRDLPGQVGVYAGVMYVEYQLFGAEATAKGKRLGVVGSAASVANRVSYALNLHGPSMTVDTMCSSSLTAIHLACQDLKQGRTSLGIAGGVNVTIHPNKYLVLSGGQFISSDGHCQSFGEGGDGYIPGEGVGVVVLKRLSDAKRDGDHIYGIIRGSALTHGGKTNGYSVPNPQAQASSISRALEEAKIDARHISYIEAHGTGTKLGDPIEIAALNRAFQPYTQDTAFCRIGSAKSNIGHCESAAGIAGLTKVLLQMQHRQIVPSLHSAQLNPHIDFAKTPFVVNQALQPWEQPVIDGRTLPRIAGISSFGAGGSNVHILIEESPVPVSQAPAFHDVAIVLSARTREQLRQKASDLLALLTRSTVDLVSVAYTLQTGREAMDERLGFIVSSTEQLVEKLRAYVAGEQESEDVYRGQVKRNSETLSLFSTDADLQQTVDKWVVQQKFAKLLELWVKGLEVDWSKLYGETRPRRVSLPTYPFARERYWIDVEAGAPIAVQGSAVAVLHPLLHGNTSDLTEQRYSSTFTGQEFFLADHQVQTQKVLPGVAYLEMARAAIEQALPARPEAAVLELRNTVWAQPVVVTGNTQVHIALLPESDHESDIQIDYEIYSGDDTVHCQGRAVFGRDAAPARVDLEQLKAQMVRGALRADAAYAICARMGLAYGPSFRAISEIERGNGQALAHLRLPSGVAEGEYVLHPSLMDGALQAAVGLLDGETSQARLPFALDTLRVLAPCTREMFAWVRYAADTTDNVVKLDVDLCDERGNVCVQLHGFASRVLSISAISTSGTLAAAPVWQAIDADARNVEYAERHVLRCELADGQNVAQRYTDFAVECFERIQSILQNRPEGNVLLRVVVPDERFAGISGLLKTAALENPKFRGQLIFASDPEREQVLSWQEVPASSAPVAFQDGGVYLITGGFGGLGTLFTREILEQTRTARVVLTGRSTLTPEKAASLDSRVTYRQLDLGDLEQVNALVAEIGGDLRGVLHSAGMTADAFIVNKTRAEFRDVLAPKVTGTDHLDQATRDVALDFFVLFSSVTGPMGNPGQADYAAANGFVDQFAAYRDGLVAAGQRHGRTRSINWPLWQDGGMAIDAAKQELLRETIGVRPMQTATGMSAFHRSLALPHAQLLVAEGDVAQMRRALLAVPAAPVGVPVESVPATDADDLAEKAQSYLREQLSGLLKLPAHKIDPHAPLENYGIDSVLVMKLTNQLEKTFGSLSKTLFFEYQTIAALAGYFVRAHAATLREVVGTGAEAPKAAAVVSAKSEKPAVTKRRKKRFASGSAAPQHKDIAIIGLAGRYPQAADLDEFWRNLREGRDSITEVPSDRWNHARFFDAQPGKAGKTYSKWGGFISDVDKFDPLFFNISPREAALIDPQERLFLETAWQTIEDAGYTKESITGGRVGVYVGVMWGQYELFGAEAIANGETAVPVSSHASIANRVSYFFDLHGPSIALDTMCSSSLTAIHMACEELRKGEIEAAIAGGVNLTLHPYKYLSLSQGQFVSTDGRCRSFGAGGDGYVPGEGVGAVLLKPLENALRDGDQVYAVIRSTTINHGGKTNGYTVPNPNAQGSLIRAALKKANVDPRTLSYIETHGTGTSLGDPIEITGLLQAFGDAKTEKHSLPIGSVKSNIGHLESAAGIAAITKALLQLRYEQLVPSLHADTLNPNIDFESSPFYVQTKLADWKRNGLQPRRIGVSSFGAGGSNAHVILEEVVAARQQASASPEIFALSARDANALRRYAEKFVQFLNGSVSLADVSYTLQVGRTAMDARLAIVASGIDELRQKLEQWLAGDAENVFHGNARDAQYGDLIDGKAGKAFVDALLASGDLEKIARLWTMGAAVNWSLLQRHGSPRRISLPTYPFAKERCWIYPGTPATATSVAKTVTATSVAKTTTAASVAKPASATPVAPSVEEKRRTYYTPQWMPRPLATGEPQAGPILVVDASDELFLALREQANEETVVLARPGEPVENLRPRVIVHHGSDDSLQTIAALCKAFMPVRVISLFPENTPRAAAIGGFFKTLSLEDPRSSGKAIEVAANLDAEAKAALVWNELRDRDWSTQEIRYRGTARLVRTLVPFTSATNGSLPIRKNGVYVITGGFGGLGIVFAEYLAKNFQAKLVLVGRTVREEQLHRLEGADVLAIQADVTRREDMERVVSEAKERFSEIHGVIHAAGVNRDAFLLKKTAEEMETVVAPKVSGAVHLDLATRDEQLDFFVLFSSLAGVMGNVGQSDYAYANHFLDAFAESRAQQRPGRSLSINWPLWEEGGMHISADGIALLEKRAGITPLPTPDGIRYFEDFLRSDVVQGVALYGIESRIAASLAPQAARKAAATTAIESSTLSAETEAYLKALLGAELQLDPERIGSTDRLESFGIDSVAINKINVKLEQDLGALPKTLLYEHETVREVAKFLMQDTREALTALFGTPAPVEAEEALEEAPAVPIEVIRTEERNPLEPIAIIGIHGYYPHSATLDEYWENLSAGRDLIDVVPPERWDAEELYSPDPAAALDGKIYCKWGGFLGDYDKFDPRFFNIPTEEAKVIDPQERLFLQSVWAAIEDAGYTRETLRKRFPRGRSANVGVFAGVTTHSYQLVTADDSAVRPSALPWSIANRVSYFFDFNGPSMPVDTACSSSLVALHLACESLRSGDCQVAIAGGVNLYLHPAKYLSLCQKRALATNGKCRSYGAGDDGFVPGEGVGSVVLKPLSKAIADGDRIHAVIAASAYDHSGRSNGYSAPNPNSQANLIRRTLEKANIHPESISYVEGHGTGTQLGDSLEIAALTQAFRAQTSKQHFCSIGSVKANLGHSESAAGIAGLAKVILQLEHRQLAPTIHADVVNPNIELDETPFYLQRELTPWESSQPRRALINSFGAGGVNACVVVEEYEHTAADVPVAGPYVFTLSAKNEDRLRDYANRLLARLRNDRGTDLASLCYTLQTGREAMEERLSLVVASIDDLIDRLNDWATTGTAAYLHRGSLGHRRGARRPHAVAEQSPSELATLWAAGEEIDWEHLYASHPPRRIALPTYPFARERYWVSESRVTAKSTAVVQAQLHPLVSYNASTLQETRFSSALSDTEFYAVDHAVNGERIFPGAAFLEMACIAGTIAGERKVQKIRDIVWIVPLSFRNGPQMLRTALKPLGDDAEYVISSFDDENEIVVHSEGRLTFGNGRAAASEDRMPLQSLKALCGAPRDGSVLYEKYREFGFQYGPSFRTIEEIYVNHEFALSRLKLADSLKNEFGQFVLHPSIIDGALQTAAGLVGDIASPTPYVPFALDEVEIVRPVTQVCYAYVERAEPPGRNRGGVTKFNIRLLNESGDVLIRFTNLYVRPLAKIPANDRSTTGEPATQGRVLRLTGEPIK